jgi:hypothetical protein
MDSGETYIVFKEEESQNRRTGTVYTGTLRQINHLDEFLGRKAPHTVQILLLVRVFLLYLIRLFERLYVNALSSIYDKFLYSIERIPTILTFTLVGIRPQCKAGL